MHNSYIGIDLFAGAGGLALGAEIAGIDVKLAVEVNPWAAETYRCNHPNTKVFNNDIRNIGNGDLSIPKDKVSVLFGGPPCQGFSTSNQKTRNKDNQSNWLFKEFIRIASICKPDWILFENVKGMLETEKGLFTHTIIADIESIGYVCSWGVLCAYDFGIPQTRSRFFLIASRRGKQIDIQKPTTSLNVTVEDALSDLPSLENGASFNVLPYPRYATSDYAKMLRGQLTECTGHLVTRNSALVIQRYTHIPQGGNWEDIPESLMANYSDRTRCHTGIYKRLDKDKPAITVGNYRKAMLIHPWENRGLSVREAARLQSFPDWYEFKGTIGFQQQQVGNAVPPLLAKAVFEYIIKSEGDK